jgi:adenosylmethionine-8-amino-7-oxononanoate aminotransferase
VAAGYPLWHPMTDMQDYLADPITIVGGEGVLVWDDDGREYLSATSGLWNVSCGFRRQEIIDAITEQLHALPYGTLFRFGNEPAKLLAKRLVEILPQGLTRIFYTTSGASAVDVALKVIRRYFRIVGRPEKRLIVCLSRSYHGTSIGSMSVTGENLEQEEYGIDRRDVRIIATPEPYRCLFCTRESSCTTECASDLLALVKNEADQIAAIIIEPILGSAGVIELPRKFLEIVRWICDEYEILLIVDEVATGFGRVGRMFASELFGLEPDAMILSKGINSGYLPLGATAFSEDLFEAYWTTRTFLAHGETQAGNPLACAAGLATLGVIEREGLVRNAEVVGEELLGSLQKLQFHPHVGCIRGRGLMIGLQLVGDESTASPIDFGHVMRVVGLLAREGLLVHPAPSGISLFPPLVLTGSEAGRIAETLDLVLSKLVLP